MRNGLIAVGLLLAGAIGIAAGKTGGKPGPHSPDEAYYFDRRYDLADADRPAPGVHPFLRSEAEVERARRNIAAFPWAKALYRRQLAEAEKLAALSEKQLRDKITDLPGSSCSCPVCGQPSNIAWDLKEIERQWDKPNAELQVTCRGCGTRFPNPDHPEDRPFRLTLDNGRKLEMSYFQGKKNSQNEGDRYFLSGVIREMTGVTVLNKVDALAEVCRISGERRYAEAGRRILRRYAEVYPGYPARLRNHYYPRYGSADWEGKLYRWKLGDSNHMMRFVNLYDAIYRSGVLSDADKVFIENDLFREYKRLMVAQPPLRDLTNSLPRGYAGMVWVGRTLADHEMIDWVLNGPQSLPIFMETWFHRDGFWHENTISYQNMAISPMLDILIGLEGYSDPPSYRGRDRFVKLKLAERLPMLGKAYLSAAPTLLPTGHVPAVNDCTMSARVSERQLAAARRYYDSPTARAAYAYFVRGFDEGGAAIDDLYTFEPEAAERTSGGVPEMVRDDRVFPGPGWALFRSGGPGPEGAALLLDFGQACPYHVHKAPLNFLYCDDGTELVTDIGYLSAQHHDTPFNKSVLAHNTVIVDDLPPCAEPKMRRVVLDFFTAGGGPVRVMRAHSPNVVPGQTKRYERTLFFLDRGSGDRCVADFFESVGGRVHTYLLHAAGEDLELPSGLAPTEWDAQKVFAAITGAKKLAGGRTAERIAGPLDFCWRDRDPKKPHTVFRLPENLAYRFCTASAPGNRDLKQPMSKRRMQLLMLRNEGDAAFFAGVLEGFRDRPAARRVEMLAARNGRAMRITTGDRVDLLLTAEEGEPLAVAEYPDLRCAAAAAAVSLERGRVTDMLAVGGSLVFGEETLEAPVIVGVVAGVDEKARTITLSKPLPASAAGNYLFVSDRSDNAYCVETAAGRAVKVADTAPLHVKPGETFRFVGTARRHK